MTLGPEHFADFFAAVQSTEERTVKPFPWQCDLVRRIAADPEGAWPDVIDVPTGGGKTAVLDIAVFLLALDAARPPAERRAATRTFLVVDRRLIVDQAAERARRIRKALKKAIEDRDAGVVGEVARRLRDRAGGGDAPPLEVAVWRGGMYLDDRLVASPCQPALCLSTVDQVGSRLLFRGYGIGPHMWPVHAGLAGIDSLILLDEAHLSGPFAETLDLVRCHQSKLWCDAPVGRAVRVVQMSATADLGKDAAPPAGITDADRADPVLGRRLRARRTAALVAARGRGDERLVDEVVAQARALAAAPDPDTGRGPPAVVAVVLNTVRRARMAFEALRRDDGRDAVLLIGRVRAPDRDRLLDAWRDRLVLGRDRGKAEPCFVVATQCIEVGVDFDVDAMVTEAAPLPALLQRAGRVDRAGELGTSRIVIVCPSERVAGEGALKPGQIDPLYGGAVAHTWRFLTERAGPGAAPAKGRGKARTAGPPEIPLDGPALLAALRDDPALAALVRGPDRLREVLDRPMLELLAQTSPAPRPDPAVAVFLHGVGSEADVQIVWRADLPADEDGLLPSDERSRDRVRARIVRALSLCPPLGGEAVTVPVREARAWLRRAAAGDVPDTAGVAAGDEPARSGGRPALLWRGPDEGDRRPSQVVGPDEIVPGAVLVVPSPYGGLDDYGWAPNRSDPVPDVADAVRAGADRRPVLRIHPALPGLWTVPEETGEDGEDPGAARVKRVLRNAVDPETGALAAGLDELVPEEVRAVLPDCAARRVLDDQGARFRLEPYDPGRPQDGLIAVAAARHAAEVTTEDDGSVVSRDITLRDHAIGCDGNGGVAGRAAAIAKGCGLPAALADAVTLAARCHDLGKAEPRFQAMLHGGDRIAARAAAADRGPLAKSGERVATPALRRTAAERAGLPRGARHEFWSVRLAERSRAVHALDPSARDLVRYLIGTHHGRGRPFPPAVADPAPGPIRLDWDGEVLEADAAHGLERLDAGWPDLFWRLTDRFGAWGLAWLEALVRSADRGQSQWEAERRPAEGPGDG